MESSVVRIFDDGCGVCSSAVIGVKGEKYRREDSALRRTSRSRTRARESILKADRLSSVDKKANDPENEF